MKPEYANKFSLEWLEALHEDEVGAKLKTLNISMSRKGNCWTMLLQKVFSVH